MSVMTPCMLVCARTMATDRLAERRRASDPPAGSSRSLFDRFGEIDAELEAMRAAGLVNRDDIGCGCYGCRACTPDPVESCPDDPPRWLATDAHTARLDAATAQADGSGRAE